MLIAFNTMTMPKFNIGCINKYADEFSLPENVETLFDYNLEKSIENMRERVTKLRPYSMRYNQDLTYVMYLGSLYYEGRLIHAVLRTRYVDDLENIEFYPVGVNFDALSYFVPMYLETNKEYNYDPVAYLVQHLYYVDTIRNTQDYDPFEVTITSDKIQIHFTQSGETHILFEYEFETNELTQIYKPLNLTPSTLQTINALLISMFNHNHYVITQNENNEYELLMV